MSSSSPAAAPATPAPHHGPQPGLVVGILALAGISVSLMQTLVIPIVGQLPVLLGSTATNTAWAITATLLAGAVVTPIAGRLGDMLGKRPVLLASLAVMVAGSVVCAFADSLLPMIVGRGLQGFAAGVIPLGISLMRDVLPAEKLGPATALMSASLGVGGALGLPAAALIADNADWHALFWVAAGLGAVVLVLIAALIPAPRGGPARPAARFDVLGAIGLSAALVSLLLGVSKGKDWGWTSATTLGLLAAAVVLALAWGAWELRTAHPLVDLRTVARRQVLLTNIASLVFGYAMFGMSLALPQIIQLPAATGYGLGESMLVAGLAMVPGGLVMMVTAGASARVTRAHGPKVSLMIGAVIVAAGYVLGAVFMDAVWQLSIVSGVIGAGIGFAYGSMPALIMSAVPASETASANSFNTLVRSVGSSVSSAVAGAVLAASATTLGTVTVPAQGGFRTVLLVAAGAALVALLVAAFLPRRTATPQPAAPLATPDPEPTTGAAVPGPRVRHSTAGDAPAAAPGVRGTVSAAGARPLPGAVVTVTDAAGRQVSRTTTGPDGRFELAVPTGGTYLLITAAPQLAPHATLVAVADRPVTQDVRLAGRSTVTGRVLAPTAQDSPDTDLANTVPVVPGALVSLTDATGHVVATSTTDGSGTYEFSSLAGGAYVLAAQAARHRPTAVGVDLGDDSASTLDLVLTPGAHLAGTVTAGPGQLPLADAVVTLVDEDGQVVARASTGSDGGYRFADLPDGDYVLTAASYAPTTRRVSLAGGRVHATDVHLGAEPLGAGVPAQG